MTLALLQVHAWENWRLPKRIYCLFQPTPEDGVPVSQPLWAFNKGLYGPSIRATMAPHSSTLAWKIPWMEEPGRLQSMGSLRVGHDWATSFHFSLSCIREGNGNPLQCSCLENPRDRGAWWAAISGVAQSWTRLKWLSSSSSKPRTLAWKIPWMEEPGGLQSMRSRRVGHDWATSLSLFTFMHWKRKW